MRGTTVEDYAKAIYTLQAQHETVSTSALAERMGTSAAAVTKMLKHLAALKIVTYTPYHGVRLSEMGDKIALEVIRHHRLLEVYLMEGLGYGWEQVHSEAERLEHHISEEFEDSIERLLGYPAFDPHGDPIPTRDGHIPPAITETLEAQPGGARVTVRRVTDEDAALLHYLGERSLRPGTEVQILEREPFGGSLRVEIAGREERISPEAARNVFVKPIPSSVMPHE